MASDQRREVLLTPEASIGGSLNHVVAIVTKKAGESHGNVEGALHRADDCDAAVLIP